MSRLAVNKTYNIYIGGKFPRTESGRYYPVELKDGTVTNICFGKSRKDTRNAVVAARNAFGGWSVERHSTEVKFFTELRGNAEG